jgi:hypothetical protein
METRMVESKVWDILEDNLLLCEINFINSNLMNPFTFRNFLTLMRGRIDKETRWTEKMSH